MKLGMPTLTAEANWEFYGKRAGIIRNQTMVSLLPHYVIAFHEDYENSKGTKDCVERARKYGIFVEFISR